MDPILVEDYSSVETITNDSDSENDGEFTLPSNFGFLQLFDIRLPTLTFIKKAHRKDERV